MEKSKVMEIISDETLTYSQQVLALARLAESEDKTLSRNPLWIKALKEGKVCDLNECKRGTIFPKKNMNLPKNRGKQPIKSNICKVLLPIVRSSVRGGNYVLPNTGFWENKNGSPRGMEMPWGLPSL